jgi:hypothetical protein
MSNDCEHKWVHLSTNCRKEQSTHGYGCEYRREDIFFCEKCLERKTVSERKYVNSGEEKPMWYMEGCDGH